MEKNFKKYALKTLMLLAFLFVLYAFFDSFIGGITAFTKLKGVDSSISLIGGLAFGCAGIFLALIIAMCVRYFNKNKKVSDLVIFIISSISFVANLIFLIVYLVELSITQIANTGDFAFVTYMVVSLIISVCYLIEYIDLYKEETGEDKNDEENKVEVQKSKTRMKRNILISLVSVVGVVCLSLYALFAGFALSLNYTTYKDNISYRDKSYVYTSTTYTSASVYVDIYFKNIETSTNFRFKVNYTLNGEQKEAVFEMNNVSCKDSLGWRSSDRLDYVSLENDELTSKPTVTVDKVSYLENGQYVEIREMEFQKYGVDKKEKAILYSAIATTVVEGIAVVFLALEIKKTKKIAE